MPVVSVLIPALDCAPTIGQVVRSALPHVADVLVVSDGSTDATAEEARAAGARVIEHDRRYGKGAALLTGLRALDAAGVERAVTMDGDGQHLGGEIPTLLRVSDASPGALVLGARQLGAVEIAPIRLFGNRFANRWVEIACRRRLPDTQSGFRVYPIRPILALGVRARHFAFETEVLIRAARAGIRMESIPVRVYYPPMKEHASHFQPFADTVRIIFVVLGLIFRVW